MAIGKTNGTSKGVSYSELPTPEPEQVTTPVLSLRGDILTVSGSDAYYYTMYYKLSSESEFTSKTLIPYESYDLMEMFSPTTDATYNIKVIGKRPGYLDSEESNIITWVYKMPRFATVSGLGSSSPSSVTFNVDADFDFNFEEVTDSLDNIFIKIPTLYRKVNTISSDSQITSYTISTVKIDSSYLPYPCFVKEDGVSVMPYILIGKYMSSSTSTCNSVNATYVIQTLATARPLARALGTGYQLYDWMFRDLFQDLVCCYLRTVNTNNGAGFSSILGIEHQQNSFWCDGVSQRDRTWLFSYKPSMYVNEPTTSTSGYNTVNYTSPSNTSTNNITVLGYDANHPFFNYPKTASGTTYTSYYCDAFRYAAGSHPVDCVVGSANAYFGVFHCYVHLWWTDTLGVRLCYRPIEE